MYERIIFKWGQKSEGQLTTESLFKDKFSRSEYKSRSIFSAVFNLLKPTGHVTHQQV